MIRQGTRCPRSARRGTRGRRRRAGQSDAGTGHRHQRRKKVIISAAGERGNRAPFIRCQPFFPWYCIEAGGAEAGKTERRRRGGGAAAQITSPGRARPGEAGPAAGAARSIVPLLMWRVCSLMIPHLRGGGSVAAAAVKTSHFAREEIKEATGGLFSVRDRPPLGGARRRAGRRGRGSDRPASQRCSILAAALSGLQCARLPRFGGMHGHASRRCAASLRHAAALQLARQ